MSCCASRKRLAPFIDRHHRVPLAESIYDDSKIAASMKSRRTKTSCLIKNVLAPEFKNLLVEKLNNTKFSIIMDKTTDCGSIKQRAFSVMYYCKRTQVSFLGMVECKKGNANHLFEVLKDMLSNNSIAKENLVGFYSDTTNVMGGAHNSIFTKLKQEFL